MKISVFCGNGLGGTEKAAFLFARELALRGYEIDLVTDSSGPRTSMLKESNVRIQDVPYAYENLREYLASARPDLVHQHVSGYGDHRPLYRALETFGASRPKLIETNVFGQLLDRHDSGIVDFRMFISMASGTQAFRRPKIRSCVMDSSRHSVVYYPLPDLVPDQSSRQSLRTELGIGGNDFLIIRVGRPSIKWNEWECQAFEIARKKNAQLKMLLIEPPEPLAGRIRAGVFGDGIIILKATSDFEYLNRLYQAADVMLHASDWGESFGYTLAEGLQAGLPVITRTTPWGDNAQVELVRQGESGFVCCGVNGMADALGRLSDDKNLQGKMSRQAREGIKARSGFQNEMDLLEEIIARVVFGTKGSKMEQRYSSWIHYAEEEFPKAQWNVYEKENHYGRFIIGFIYSGYRTLRFRVGSTLRRFSSYLKSR